MWHFHFPLCVCFITYLYSGAIYYCVSNWCMCNKYHCSTSKRVCIGSETIPAYNGKTSICFSSKMARVTSTTLSNGFSWHRIVKKRVWNPIRLHSCCAEVCPLPLKLMAKWQGVSRLIMHALLLPSRAVRGHAHLFVGVRAGIWGTRIVKNSCFESYMGPWVGRGLVVLALWPLV